MAATTSSLEIRIQSALVGVQQGHFPHYQAAAEAWQVPASTLRHRANGRTSKQSVHQVHSKLTKDQEEMLERYIRDLQLLYAPINHRIIAQVA